ncbi:MAG: stage II sporulation protein M [Gemmatimonadota bacterium]|nr:stage II sporulation protein M [Gemmatimonadota bacterium]MDH4349083.1 stage II sporulation protein M [Gemmatimonadota bacterium]MDH5283419.1 stage II sporulation protein M [Gemmatimonadota bacterium]
MARTDYRQHLEVETPEHVVLDYEIAGLGSRTIAAVVDMAILLSWGFALLVITIVVSASAYESTWFFAIYGILWFASSWGYFVFFEGLRAGQTPGKRRVGIRVVRDTGHPVSVGAAAIRNLLRLADFLPPPYLLGAILVGIHPRGKRLGDLVAGTVVVWDRPSTREAGARAAPRIATASAGPPQLDEEEFRLLEEYLARAGALEPVAAARLEQRLLARFADRFPGSGEGEPAAWLERIHSTEYARRQSPGPAHAGTSAIAAAKPADRLVARQSARWAEFEVLALRAASRGLDSFGAEELPDFASRYRELAADLARARTYRAPRVIQHRLERLVTAGHNSLYRAERTSPSQVWEFLARECPASLVQARRAIAVAFLAFFLPATAGFLLMRERPELAMDMLPEVLLERAEAGKARQQLGQGYYEASPESRPMVASAIMTNNVGVAIACFAGGVFAGVGSVVLLGFNGLSIGATAGHFANAGLLGYLSAFIVGHGVLELFAIWVAGAAGLLLGLAMVAPGELTRADAVRVRGRLATRLLTAVVIFLVIAGVIEGFVSAGTGPLALRIGVSASSLAFLVLYLLQGVRALGRAVWTPTPGTTP